PSGSAPWPPSAPGEEDAGTRATRAPKAGRMAFTNRGSCPSVMGFAVMVRPLASVTCWPSGAITSRLLASMALLHQLGGKVGRQAGTGAAGVGLDLAGDLERGVLVGGHQRERLGRAELHAEGLDAHRLAAA